MPVAISGSRAGSLRRFRSAPQPDTSTTPDRANGVGNQSPNRFVQSPGRGVSRQTTGASRKLNHSFVLTTLPSPEQYRAGRQPSARQLEALRITAAAADEVIGEAIDEGNKKVDLSGLGLAELPDSIIDLKFLTSWSASDARAHRDLELFLACNHLGSMSPLSSKLFQLDNLTVLSLRGNKLKQIPHAIAVLRNLKSLSLSSNQLSTLPSEVADLPHLELLSVRPNPLWNATKIKQNRLGVSNDNGKGGPSQYHQPISLKTQCLRHVFKYPELIKYTDVNLRPSMRPHPGDEPWFKGPILHLPFDIADALRRACTGDRCVVCHDPIFDEAACLWYDTQHILDEPSVPLEFVICSSKCAEKLWADRRWDRSQTGIIDEIIE
eukprot:Clim_evm14s237 gene=Clim_evmTU14s237